MSLSTRVARTVFTLSVFALAACGGGESRSAGTSTDAAPQRGAGRPLTIRGSDTMVILTQRLAETYMGSHQGESVQVNGGGSGTGIAALINGSVDLAQASRPMKGDEKSKAAKARGAEIIEQPVALDALAVFVHASNPVKELTIAQLSDIFTGKIQNWSQLGGSNSQIVLYGRESSSGTYDYFREHVLSKADFSPRVQTLQGTAAIINAVSKDANGIGYGGIAYAQQVRALGVKSDAATPAVSPSEATVADNSYPLSRKLFFCYPANAPERVTKFVQWTLTPEAQSLVTQVGYFPLKGGGASGAPAAGTSTDQTSTDQSSTPSTSTDGR